MWSLCDTRKMCIADLCIIISLQRYNKICIYASKMGIIFKKDRYYLSYLTLMPNMSA